MSDHIEVDGKKYFEESYLQLGIATAKRRGERIKELEALLDHLNPQPHWSAASKSLVMRLRGVYAIGPNADLMGPDDQPEFGWRDFKEQGFQVPGIQLEAAQRIQDLEKELQKYRERFFQQECDLRGIQTEVGEIKSHYTFPKDL